MKEDSANDKFYNLLLTILKNETEDVAFRKSIKRIPIGYQDSGGGSLTSLIILHSCSPLKHTRIVLQMGYSVSTPDKNGWTPLHHTVHGCQVKIDRAGLILLLLANGVKIDVKTTDEGLSSFMIACIMGDVQLAELLLARGASIHNTVTESYVCGCVTPPPRTHFYTGHIGNSGIIY
jgi:ankyrin repeat protein